MAEHVAGARSFCVQQGNAIMKVVLVTFSKSGVRKEFPVEGNTMVIGRKTDADLRIPVGEVSRQHCRISIKETKLTLQDLESSNGTLVNNQKILQATLNAGDSVRVGPVTFIIQIDGQPAEISPPTPGKPGAGAMPAERPTELSRKATFADDSNDIDIDDMEELDIDDVSDLDLDGLDLDEDDDDVEELDENDLVVDDSSDIEVTT
ncbi:MAG: FHA domain-containing protein [Planctomycetota bacterium]